MSDTSRDMLRVHQDTLSRLRPEDAILDPLNAYALAAVHVAQLKEGFGGDIAEIGVYRGGTFAVLCAGLGPHERAFAIDIFDKCDDPRGPSNDPEAFRATVARVTAGAVEPVCIAADTLDAADRAATRATVGAGCRLVHVDGDHRLTHLSLDLETAQALTARHPSPVIVVDDTFAPSMPEVTEGLIDFIRADNPFVPFAIVENKTYLCHARHVNIYGKYFIVLMQSRAMDDVRHIAGWPVMVLKGALDGFCALEKLDDLPLVPWAFPIVPIK